MLKEFLVTVKNPDDFDGLHEQLIDDKTRGHYLAKSLEGETVGVPNIPDRPVELVDYRPGSLRTAHYLLTDEEAEELKKDSRVQTVEPHLRYLKNVKIERLAIQSGIFDKSFSTNNQYKNWGLKSCTSNSDPFGNKTQLSSIYPYCLDGSNVDIIVVDSGIIPNHPEFAVNADGTGGSRVKQIDWFAETGIPGSMPANHYTDEDGHGTHCAGIAAGNTCGWAKKANIYTIKAITDWGVPAVDIYNVFDLIRVWHTNKPINPATGKKNPTIVNCSWSFVSYSYGAITEFNFRGQQFKANNFTTTERAAKGLVNYNFLYGGNVHNVRISSIDAEIQDCLDAGVIIVGAAGNYYHKIDVPGGQDYNNYYLDSFGGNYYHRGGTPGSTPGVICVGNIDSVYPEQKSFSSETGPRVNIYAPGTAIMSSYNSGVNDPRKNGYFLAKLSGTSMASPQVVGALALILQLKPWLTPAQALAMLNSLSVKNRITAPTSESFTNYRSLQGSANYFLFMPYTANQTGQTLVSTTTTNFAL